MTKKSFQPGFVCLSLFFLLFAAQSKKNAINHLHKIKYYSIIVCFPLYTIGSILAIMHKRKIFILLFDNGSSWMIYWKWHLHEKCIIATIHTNKSWIFYKSTYSFVQKYTHKVAFGLFCIGFQCSFSRSWDYIIYTCIHKNSI